MVVRRIRNRTNVAMLCMDPVFSYEPMGLSDLSSLTVPISHSPPVQLVQPVQYIYGLLSTISLFLPFISFHFLFTSTSETNTCYQSAIDSIVDLFSLFSYSYCYPLDPANHEDTAGKKRKTHFITRTLSLSQERERAPSVRPSVRHS